MAVIQSDIALPAPTAAWRQRVWRYIRRHPTIIVGGVLLLIMLVMAVFAPYLNTVDPQALSPIKRLRWPSAQYWFGTDMLGRDVYSRTVYGARVADSWDQRRAVQHGGRPGDRRCGGLHPLGRRGRDAHHGRADVDPGGA